jgi:hypothetical protein
MAENIKENQKKQTILSNIDLFFHPSGMLRQSYEVEDKEKNVLFRCKLAKWSFFFSMTYEFADLKSGSLRKLKIGKTITSHSTDGIPIVGDILSSRFKIDGENCWEYIAKKGYEIKQFLEGKALFRYEVVKNGKVLAQIFPANVKYPFDKEKVNYLRMGKGYYRIEITEGNLEDIVLMAFIIARTEIVE